MIRSNKKNLEEKPIKYKHSKAGTNAKFENQNLIFSMKTNFEILLHLLA